MHDDYRERALNRWKTIEGHVRGVRRMLEDDRYCLDILKQASAIQGAIDSANALVLEHHLQTCVTTAIRGEVVAERERVLGELLALFPGSRGRGGLGRLESAPLCVLDTHRARAAGQEETS